MRFEADRWLLIIVFLLITMGLLSVYSSTSVVSPDVAEKSQSKGKNVSSFDFVRKQLFTVFLGLFAMIAAYKLRIKDIRHLTFPLLIISLVCLILVFTPLGVSAGGARRWLRLWPSVFQPSELVKLSMVIFVAWYMSSKHFNRDKVQCFLIPVAVMAVFQIIFIKQPDFGAVMSLGILTLAMLFVGGVRLRYIAMLGLLALPVIYKLASEPYRLKRITSFLDPWKDPLGSGFQLVQSFIALGSGGVRGVGLGEGRQKLAFLPEIHTDFIFSLIGEEMGFVGSLVVIILFLMLFVKGMSIARNSGDPFSSYIAYGITMMISFQALINFAVVTGMIPTKGLPLPFISYGGSSMLVNMTAVGLLLNISRQNKINKGALRMTARGIHRFDNPRPVPATQNITIKSNGFKRVYTFNRRKDILF